jgi:flagellar hook-associated protein 3 FlgL
MAITRVTQNMLTQRSLGSLQTNLNRMARTQEQLSTGRIINRPSDSPTGTASAMRLRDNLAATQQYQRNAQDGLAWLGTVDTTLTSITDQTREARDAALQGANSGAIGPAARNALAATVDQLRASLLSDANTTYLDRPVFGGITSGSTAYAEGALPGDPVTFTGVPGEVKRTIGDGVSVRVDQDGTKVFGPAGDSVFEHLTALSDSLRSGDQTGIAAGIDQLNTDLDRMIATHSEVGTRYKRVDAANQTGADGELSLKSSLSEIENADLPAVIVEMKMQETAYQASLAATARVMQPSLLDFLR